MSRRKKKLKLKPIPDPLDAIFIKFPAPKPKPRVEPIDHQVEQAADRQRYFDAAANLLRAVVKGGEVTDQRTATGVRKKKRNSRKGPAR